jgi:Uma2 family endonuclease
MTATDHLEDQLPGYRSRMNEQEFEAWALRERVQAEWVEGEVILMSPVSVPHADIVSWLNILLGLFVARHRLGKVIATEVMVRLQHRRRLPDIFFVRQEREGNFSKTYLEGAPDLIVEVVSPDSESRDWREKYLEYQESGVAEYWVIDPNSAHAEFYGLKDGKYQTLEVKQDFFHSLVLKGFHFNVTWLWQQPLPNVYETAKMLGII